MIDKMEDHSDKPLCHKKKAGVSFLYILMGFAVAALAVFSGYYLGRRVGAVGKYPKLNALLELIDDEYVDSISPDSLQEKLLPLLLEQLDPHCAYLPPDENSGETARLEGSFSGIGVQFNTIKDTVVVVSAVEGGPSARAGVKPGDRIVAVNGKSLVLSTMNTDSIRAYLKGEEGSIAALSILRNGKKKEIRVTRGAVPVYSLDAAYQVAPKIMYMKFNGWARTTHQELLAAISDPLRQGLKGLILDLRGNGGGYMDAAIALANEFLKARDGIVMVEGRAYKKEVVKSNGSGVLKDLPLVILIDELTASSSEIFSGAMQDNDRAMIVGRRSFGKGLVQQPIDFTDGSQVRLTVARYYTPSGRCIQKPFVRGDNYDYSMELQQRFDDGDLYHTGQPPKDPKLVYKTKGGRLVYGGGGITPDLFVPADTSGITGYYLRLSRAGSIPKFAFVYSDANREKLSKFQSEEELIRYLDTQGLLYKLANYAALEDGVQQRTGAMYASKKLILRQLYALIADNVFGRTSLWKITNMDDQNIVEAVKLLQDGKAWPNKKN